MALQVKKSTFPKEEGASQLPQMSPMSLLKNKFSILKEGKEQLNASLLLGPGRFLLPHE